MVQNKLLVRFKVPKPCEWMRMRRIILNRVHIWDVISPLTSFIFSIVSAKSTSHPCLRECNNPPKPKTCHYSFTIEAYYVLSRACFDCPLNKSDCLKPQCVPLNGVKRSIMTVNRQIPGPSIEVNIWIYYIYIVICHITVRSVFSKFSSYF